jgi:tetratricopeptide (TPR) repeat protein
MSRRRLCLLLGLLLLVVLALPGWWVFIQTQARRHLADAEAALLRDDPKAARPHLAYCLSVWLASAQVYFLDARAARRSGELTEAVHQLGKAAELGWDPKAIELERALLRAQAEELKPVEGYLLSCVAHNHPDTGLILEVLTPAYMRNFNMPQAVACSKRWIEVCPQSVAAWTHRGMIAESFADLPKTLDAFREAVRLDPSRRRNRLTLCRHLLDANLAQEALPMLEDLTREDPSDLAARFRLARCYVLLNRRNEARMILSNVLDREPDHTGALHLYGRMELEDGNPKAAARFLRLAVERQRFDGEVLDTWLRCVRLVGKPAEVEYWEARYRQVSGDLDRIAVLTKEIVERPDDPEPRCEAGKIYLRNGQEEDGLSWFRSALEVKPDHAATHRALAEYYESKGDLRRADPHRRVADRAVPQL